MCSLFLPIGVLLLCNFVIFSYGLQCNDQNNKPVDWYFIYKLPKQTDHTNEFIKEGVGFIYMTSNNYAEWTLSKVDINDTKSMVANTLSEFYSNKKNLYILYNDQPPYGSASETKGHTKGVVMANGTHGFWLIHSVPHFPMSLEQYVYPTTGVHYGQSFLCISLQLNSLNNVGLQLQFNEPHIFAQNIPESLTKSTPELLKAANNETIKNAPWYNVENITSLSGINFVSFAKSGKFDKDLYSDFVSSELGSDLYVETWPNEPNRLPSDCDNKFQVDNILSISMSDPLISFKTTVDHSKWAVSTPSDSARWICIGDINRAEKQTQRGGGTTCLNNEKVATQYQKIVSSIQQCENNYFYKVYANYVD